MITLKMADQGRSDFFTIEHLVVFRTLSLECRCQWTELYQETSSFYHEPLSTWIKTFVNKFAISNHTALILRVNALKSYLKLICEYELHSLTDKKLVAQRIMVKTTS